MRLTGLHIALRHEGLRLRQSRENGVAVRAGKLIHLHTDQGTTEAVKRLLEFPHHLGERLDGQVTAQLPAAVCNFTALHDQRAVNGPRRQHHQIRIHLHVCHMGTAVRVGHAGFHPASPAVSGAHFYHFRIRENPCAMRRRPGQMGDQGTHFPIRRASRQTMPGKRALLHIALRRLPGELHFLAALNHLVGAGIDFVGFVDVNL